MVIDGLILAGGQSRRMGQDKASLVVANKTLVLHQIEMMSPEVNMLIIARGEQPPLAAKNNVAVIKDFYRSSSEGPLSGLLAAMQMSSADYLWVMTCDNYGFNAEIRKTLTSAIEDSGADVAYARIDGRLQPLLAIVNTGLRNSLLSYLEQGERSVLKWYRTINAIEVDVCPETVFYSNINTPDDYQALLKSL